MLGYDQIKAEQEEGQQQDTRLTHFSAVTAGA
jgi:hypothetical protein